MKAVAKTQGWSCAMRKIMNNAIEHIGGEMMQVPKGTERRSQKAYVFDAKVNKPDSMGSRYKWNGEDDNRILGWNPQC